MPDFVTNRPYGTGYWALAVPHNFSTPPPGSTITVFVSAMRPDKNIARGDVIFAFSRGRLSMAAKVTDSHTPPDLQMSLELCEEPSKCRAYITTVEAEILRADLQAPYDNPNTCMSDALNTEVKRQFDSPHELFHGDARPFHEMIGVWLNSVVFDLGW